MCEVSARVTMAAGSGLLIDQHLQRSMVLEVLRER